MAAMTTTRRPYPYPTYEGDNEFMGTKPREVYESSAAEVAPRFSQRTDPWVRLNSTLTLSSLRREATYYDPQAPRDALDFQLKAEYNQHREFLKDRHETVLQRETLGAPGIRVLKNRSMVIPRVEPSLGHPLRTVSSARKENIHSVKSSISGHHTQTTNVGYSRKPDGGYYTS